MYRSIVPPQANLMSSMVDMVGQQLAVALASFFSAFTWLSWRQSLGAHCCCFFLPQQRAMHKPSTSRPSIVRVASFRNSQHRPTKDHGPLNMVVVMGMVHLQRGNWKICHGVGADR
jgi:hypothetical protein